MNTTNYIMSPGELLLATEIASKIASVLTVVLLGFILFGTLLGFRRGLLRQGFHLGVTLAVAAVAFFSISNLCGGIVTSFSELTAEELMGYIELQLASQGQSMPPEVYEQILPIAENIDFTGVGLVLSLVINTILAPVLFLLVFIIVRLLAKLIANVVGWFIPRGRKPVQKLLGALAGAVEGAVVAGVIILPIVMALNVTGAAAGVIVDNTPSEDEINSEYAEYVYESIDNMNEIVHIYDEISTPISESFAVKTVSSLGGEAILKGFATIEFDGAKVDLRDELTNVLRFASKISFAEMAIYPPDGFSDYEEKYISDIVDMVNDSSVISNVLYTALHTYASIGGMSPEYEEVLAEEPMAAVILDLVLNKTDASTIGANLTTLKNVFFILMETYNSDMDGDFYELLLVEYENGKTVLDDVVAELEKNPNTAHLPDALVGAVMSQMGMGESEEYEAAKDTLSQIVQIETEGKEKEEVKEEVKDTFVEILGDFDITVGEEEGDISEEELDAVVDFFTEELMNGNLDIPVDENGQISDVDLMELMIKYQKYFEENGNGSESDSNDGGNEENITEIIPDQE